MARIGATLFSGGRGVEALLTDAIDFRLAVEYDPQIAAVGAQLGGDTIVSRVEDVDYSTWPALDYLHASPVCKNASQAKTNGEESDGDKSSAAAVVRCLEATQPRVFTLENVQGYCTFEAFRSICRALDRLGYMWHYEVLNSADFGVPQTRRRLILRAVRDALLPPLPAPEPWIGWYAAIEDLIPTLPPSQFTPWQLERLPGDIKNHAMFGNQAPSWDENEAPIIGHRMYSEPSLTVLSTGSWRAFILSNAATEYSDGIRDAAEPMLSITTQTGGRARAWFVNEDSKMGIIDADTPAPTQVSSARARSARALLVGGGNTNTTIVDSKAREETDPDFTITHARVRDRAWLSAGRVVKMTPRALAGNMVPSLLMSKIVRPLL